MSDLLHGRAVSEGGTPSGEPADLGALFHPQVIAVVGAHDERLGLKDITRRAIDKADLSGGRCYLVNPTRAEVFGARTYQTTADIPEDIDVLVVLVGDASAAIEQAASRHPKFTIVFAGGYGELGTAEGAERQQRLLEVAQHTGTRVLGPNTNANTLEPLLDLQGPRIGIVAQSGMQGRPVAQGQEIGVAVSGWAVTGNEADLEAAEFIEFMARDPATDAVAAYIEGFRDGDRIRQAALTALEQRTPVIVVKVGKSTTGAAASLTHTGHIAGADAVHQAFFDQYGITRVDDLDELLEVSMVLSRCSPPESLGVGLLCTSGGSAAHISDLVSASGLPVPTLSAATQRRLHELIPVEYQVTNPVDNGGVALMQGNGPAIAEAMLADESVGVLLLPVTGVFAPHMAPVYETVRHAHGCSSKPVIVIWSGPTINDTYRAIIDAGVPVVRNVRNAVTATKALLRFGERCADHEFQRMARALAPPSLAIPATRPLDEEQSMQWLESHGLRFVERASVTTVEEAVAAADRIGYPLVLKGRGSLIAHKTERGLVALGVGDEAALRDCAARIAERAGDTPVEGWIVARQMQGGFELLVGLSHDPLLGPVVTVGAGGVHAEVAGDHALSVLPLTEARAWEMVRSLRLAPLLDGVRGQAPADQHSLVRTLLVLAHIAEHERVHEVDINPLLVTADGAIGLDALVRLDSPT